MNTLTKTICCLAAFSCISISAQTFTPYADGLPRLCSNRCSFAVAGGFAPQRGSICMDMCMADVSDLPEAAVDSEVEIFGGRCSLEKLSAAAQTIPYELLCAVSKRVPRVYQIR